MSVVEARSSLPPKPKPKPKPGLVKVVRALYNYTARYPNELTFQEGDILYVFDQSKPDWWRARCGNKTGLIPSNYVEGQVEEVREPLHEAARRGNLSFLEECLNQGVSSTGLDSMGNTPLYWASHSGHVDCLKCLLKQANPPVNAQNHFGDTPLHAAAARNHYQAAELLLKNGADPSIENNSGEMPDVLAMDMSLKNLLQMHKLRDNRRHTASFSPEEYADDDSD